MNQSTLELLRYETLELPTTITIRREGVYSVDAAEGLWSERYGRALTHGVYRFSADDTLELLRQGQAFRIAMVSSELD